MAIPNICSVPSCANAATMGYEAHLELNPKADSHVGVCDACWARHCDEEDKFDLRQILAGEMKVPRHLRKSSPSAAPPRTLTTGATEQQRPRTKLRRLRPEEYTRPGARAQYSAPGVDVWNEVHGGVWYIEEEGKERVTVKNYKEAKTHLGLS